MNVGGLYNMHLDWNIWLLVAGLLSLLTAAVHFFLGGREVALPLLQARDINNVAKHTNYYCWHLVTIVLVAMGAGFIHAALQPGDWVGAVTWTGLAGAFTLWNIALILWKRLNPKHMVQWALFLPITATGMIGLLS